MQGTRGGPRLVPFREQAEVAELADAPDSKSGSLRGVWVRFPPSALAFQGNSVPSRTTTFPAATRTTASQGTTFSVW
jgi:hypothetical protein